MIDLELAILRRIAAGESPYTFTGALLIGDSTIAITLEALRRDGFWVWQDPSFPVMRRLTQKGKDAIR